MSRNTAIDLACEYFDGGAFRADLVRRVAYRTESQDPRSGPVLRAYLVEEIIPQLQRLGFEARVVSNPASERHPFLLARRCEHPSLPTVLTYGHGDVQLAHADQWRPGLDPWEVTVEGEHWYGRGTADNKGQHTVNLAALEQVLRVREGRLGYNVTVLLDMGEEAGSPGLSEVCAALREELAADLLIASDGPRLSAEQPTVFLGSRGSINFTLRFAARNQSHHSGNWGGVLSNPAVVLANALASMVDGRGKILVEGLRPPRIPASVREALANVAVDRSAASPGWDDSWGEPGLTPSERLFGWNTLEILAMTSGDPDGPVNAIPSSARAHCQLRFVVGTDWTNAERIMRDHLDRHGFSMVEVEVEHSTAATRLDPEDKWVGWALESLQRTTGKTPALLPNLAGSLPNDAFADVLGLPTIWIPHSYPGCAQHAPNEHLKAPLMREAMRIMAGIFWDLGSLGPDWLSVAGSSSHSSLATPEERLVP
ncbi:MAG TPA: M20 family metallopeptidase [Micrococcaceae bacterium]|jgi:acetylornithine deacetylase/succinyl-diaminopimelate desuccinylase-like protein|nr:M20 family metallopeptidase [Micrococcaceae bacterium]